MKIPHDVFIDECGALYVCDNGNGRVLVFNSIPSGNGAAADAVLGKPSLTAEPSASTPPSDAWMGGCNGLTASGSSLFVGDAANNRVLRFSLSR